MTYSQFKTIRSVKQAFELTVVEGDRFLPNVSPKDNFQYSASRATTVH